MKHVVQDPYALWASQEYAKFGNTKIMREIVAIVKLLEAANDLEKKAAQARTLHREGETLKFP